MSIIQNIENFSTQTTILCLGPSGPKYQFLQGESIGFSQKTEHYVALSLSFPCEIFCFKPVFGACSYTFSQFCLHIGCAFALRK